MPVSRDLLRRVWRAVPVPLRSWGLVLALRPFLSRPAPVPPPPPEAPLYVAGSFRAATGLGQSARLYAREAAAAGRTVRAVDLTDVLGQTPVDGLWTEPLMAPDDPAGAGPGTLVVHVNPPLYLLALWRLRRLAAGKRLVAYWAWELLTVPGYWRACLPLADAVEAPSTFTAAALAQAGRTPVTVHPHHLAGPVRAARQFAADGTVRVLTVFDMASNFARKNPLGAVAAFTAAFGGDPRYVLTLKTSSLERSPAGRAALAAATAGRDDIRLVDARLSGAELEALYTQNDIYLSMHRSEGYGLTVAEAMRRGLSVVATGWSGNMDFMAGARCHAVPYRLVAVADRPGGTFARGGVWAEPDVGAAARCLRRIVATHRPDLLPPGPPEAPPPVAAGDVGVVLVNYGRPDDSLACLAALAQLRTRPGRIVVADNGSPEAAVGELLRGWTTLARRHGLPAPKTALPDGGDPAGDVLLTLPENLGFAGGNNAAIRLLLADAGCRAVWLLNNDTAPEPGALDALCVRLAMRPDAGAAGSLVVAMAAPGRVLCAGGGRLTPWTGLTRDLLRGEAADRVGGLVPELVETRLDFLTGASMLLPRAALEAVGLLDAGYFLYDEDVEFCLRLGKAGLALVVAPGSRVPHREGATNAALAPLVDYLCIRNRLRLVAAHRRARLPAALARQCAVAVWRLVRGDAAGARRAVRAVLAFARGETGRPAGL